MKVDIEVIHVKKPTQFYKLNINKKNGAGSQFIIPDERAKTIIRLFDLKINNELSILHPNCNRYT